MQEPGQHTSALVDGDDCSTQRRIGVVEVAPERAQGKTRCDDARVAEFGISLSQFGEAGVSQAVEEAADAEEDGREERLAQPGVALHGWPWSIDCVNFGDGLVQVSGRSGS